MEKNTDIKFMKRALELSLGGYGFVNPNPLVGAVLVKDGEIIGEGFHEIFGEPHAEINAIESSKHNVEGSTMYVTMEPCNHTGKTPPCTERIIMEKISRVVIGMRDPNVKVKGNGILRLTQSGVSITQGVLEKEIKKVNEVFTKYAVMGLPYCSMKTAMTMDGKISTFTGDSKWISNEKSRKWVHELRHRYSAIMVGVNTIITDDPSLNNRSNHKEKSNPVRVIVDSGGRTPLNAKVLNPETGRTFVAITNKASKEFVNKVEKKGSEIILCPEKEGKVDLGFLIVELGKKSIDSILLEGGSTLNFSAIQAGIVDKVYSFISPKMVGGQNANTPIGGVGIEKINDAITLNIDRIRRFDEDIFIESYIVKF